MKRILVFMVFVASLWMSLPVVAQGNYKYLFTETATGSRTQRPNLVSRFNTGATIASLRFSNNYQNVHFDYNGQTSFTLSYRDSNGSVLHYQGPIQNTRSAAPSYGIDVNALAEAISTPVIVNLWFDVPSGATSVVDVYFNSDYSRMNIKPRGTPGVTHVFERGTAIQTPGGLL